MIYTRLTKAALLLSFEAHKDQVDKSGMPYVYHPFHLAESMKDEYTTVVALLHDVVGDTDYTLEDLAEMGYPKEVVEALSCMTHDPDTPYMEYVAKIAQNPIARAVKIADLLHNSDLTRLDEPNESAYKRVEKYKEALRILTESEK